MTAKKTAGRPPKINYKIIIMLADAIQHNSSITEACLYAGVSRQFYYHHLNNNAVFAEKMATAKENRNKVVFSFLTVP